ncbi:MAG TPA: ABC transporter permease [Terracidiphilus sp.]|nr:ABC transporter permease [Terracidiphilus sp.]
MPSRIVSLFRNLLRKDTIEQALDDELQSSVELLTEEKMKAGLSHSEARRRALIEIGGVEQVKEEVRAVWAGRLLEDLAKDVRYAFRTLAKSPGFTAVAVLTLALGIGASAAMFTILDAVLLKPLPFPEPERMVRVWETLPNGSPNETTTLTFLDWKRQNVIFEALAAERRTRAAVGTGEDLARVEGELVSADYFQVFGVKPRLGRAFAQGEDQAGASPVVVLSYSFWQTRFGGDPGVLKRDLVIDGEPHRIIGVLPAGCFDRDEAAFWKPLIFAPEQMNRNQHLLPVVGRLRAGVSLEQARARMNVLRASLAPVMAEYKDWGFAVEPFAQRLVGDTLRRSLYLVFGAVLMVLLIACANVANLVLVKGAARRREMALRAALGARRGRLIGQLLTESLVLFVLGGAAGLAVAHLLLSAAIPLLSASLPFTADLGMDLRVFGFAAAALMLVLILAGLLPSLQTSFSKLSGLLNQAGRGSSRSSAAVRRTIVIAEVAASLVLLCGAGLLFKSLVNLQRVGTGVRMDHVITMSVDLPSAAYPDPQRATRFFEEAVERLRAVPGVEQACVAQNVPLQGVGWGEGMGIRAGEGFGVGLKLVDPWYFSTFGIPVESGRGIEEQDRAGRTRVVVINQEVARQLSDQFGMTNPVGRTVVMDLPGYGPVPESVVNVQIAGVIRSERTGGLQAPQERVAYAPLAQVPRQDVKLVVRTWSEPVALMPGIREAVRQVDAHLPLADVRTMEQVKEQSMLWLREPAWVVGAFAGAAALLAAIGLYGVLAYTVTEQRREIGIRMALGARQGDVLSHVLRNSLSMLIVGLAAGLAGAFALTRALKSLLFNVSALDPVALSVACVLMMLIGILAAWIPARRATQVDPIVVLRHE